MVIKANQLLAEADELGYPKPESISVSIGGPLDIQNGIIFSPIHLPDCDNIHLKDLISELFSLPTLVEHDGNAWQ